MTRTTAPSLPGLLTVAWSLVWSLVWGLAAGPSPVVGQVRMVEPENGAILLGATPFVFDTSQARGEVNYIDVHVDGKKIGTARPPDWSFEWNAPSGLVEVPVVAAVFVDGALVQKIRIRSSEVVVNDVIDVMAVELFPVVTDQRGRYVGDLEAEDFRILDRGVEVELHGFSRQSTSLSVSVAIDISASMKDRLPAVRMAVHEFIGSLAHDDLLSIYAFNHNVSQVTAWTRDHDAALASVRGLRASGSTSLYDAVTRLGGDMRELSGRKVAIVFSDGRDELSESTLTHAIAAARVGNAILYTVASGQGRRDLEARDDLEQLAEDTGGQAYVIAQLAELPRVFSEILADIRSQYSLSFSPRDRQEGTHPVQVRVRGDGYSVRCRTSYVLGDR